MSQSKAKVTGRTFPEGLNGKQWQPYNNSSYLMSKTPSGKCKCHVKVKSGIKKVRKEYLQETISLLSLPAHSEVLTQMPREVIQEVIFVFLQLCVIQHKKELRVAGSTFDGGWVTRWWWDVDGAAENEGWAVSIGEDGKVRVYGGVTVNRNGSGMLDGGWSFS